MAQDSDHLRICLIGCFPPSRGDLNEYGFHLASALSKNSAVELIILADETMSPQEVDGFQVERCWRFNSLLTPARLLRAIQKAKPDVVWFNMGFSTFANGPIAAFLSVTSPAIARWSGFYTHVTLHTIFERINLKDAGVRMPGAYRAAGRIATRALLHADDLSVLLPSFRSDLVKNYGADGDRVHFRPHGIFSPAIPGERVHTDPTVLAFGYWGTYKRLDLLVECWPKISERLPKARLMVAGLNHPNAPGYLESLQERYASYSNVQFLGYVAEEALPDLFRKASVLVLPYSSAAGTSGVVHQACEHGLPMVAASIPEIEELAREYRLAIRFYDQGDGTALTNHLIGILGSDDLQREMAKQNLAVAGNMQISQVVNGYLNLFRARTRRTRPASHSKHNLESAPSPSDLSHQVGEWLLHSGIEESDGGVARYYLSDEKRNKPVSTEITGYCASALVVLHQCTGEQKYRQAALEQADFLAKRAWNSKCKAMPFELAGDNRNYSYFFDVGIIVRGLLAVWRMSGKAELLDAAIGCGKSMMQDFFNGKDFDPIITLPDKKAIPQVAVKWSRSSGCYQLKAALAWQGLWEATGEDRFLEPYRRLLKSSLDSHLSFLPGSEDDLEVMNRLHAYSYFLEGLLPVIPESEHRDADCRNAMTAGIDRLAHYARTIAPQFLRSDVIAQLLRVRIFADQAGVASLDRETASYEASLLREFQSSDSDPRLKNGFWFGRKPGTMLPFMNPVSTVFCYQALEMWERYQSGERRFSWQNMI